MIALGIDHGSETGICIVKDGAIETEGFKVEGKGTINKLFSYREHIREVLDRTKPNVVCIEVPSSFINGETTRQLIGFYTLNIVEAKRRDIEIVEIKPSHMKKAITGKGNATKHEVYTALIEKWNVPKEMIFQADYYKIKSRLNEIKTQHYDKSDATGLVLTYLNSK